MTFLPSFGLGVVLAVGYLFYQGWQDTRAARSMFKGSELTMPYNETFSTLVANGVWDCGGSSDRPCRAVVHPLVYLYHKGHRVQLDYDKRGPDGMLTQEQLGYAVLEVTRENP